MEILLGFRGEIAFMVPLMIFIFAGDLLSLSPPLENAVAESAPFFYCFLAVCLFLIIVFFPILLKILWRMKPLDRDLSLRAELDAFMRKQGFRARDIVIWGTGGLIVNAAIVGVLPRFRYILLTDTLLKLFRADELKAIVAHEIGHGRRKHAFYLIVVSMAFISLLGLLESRLDVLGSLENDLLRAGFLYVPTAIGYIWFVFGFISRRLEVEADIFAVKAVSDRTIFARTLERLAALTAAARHRRSFRHFSPEHRVALLEQYFPDGAAAESPRSEPLRRFENRMRRMKAAGLFVSLLVIGLFVLDLVG